MPNPNKRFLAFCLALLMLLSASPLGALSEIFKTDYSGSVSVMRVISPVVATHTYRFYDGGALVQTQIIKDGETLLEPRMSEGQPGQIFEGWFVGATQMTFGPKTVSATATFDVNAVYRPGFYVRFLYNGEVIKTKEVAPGTTTDDSGVSYTITDPTQTFSHWAKNGSAFSFATPINEDTNLVLVTRDGFQATFYSTGGSAVLPVYTGPDGKITKPANPSRAGYTFQFWTRDLTNPVAFDFNQVLTSSISLYAVWQGATVNYKVAHWFENANDTNHSLVLVENKTGTSGTNAAYTAYTTQVGNVQFQNFKNGTATPQVIAGDGSTVVHVYYQRNTYALKFYRYDINSWVQITLSAQGSLPAIPTNLQVKHGASTAPYFSRVKAAYLGLYIREDNPGGNFMIEPPLMPPNDKTFYAVAMTGSTFQVRFTETFLDTQPPGDNQEIKTLTTTPGVGSFSGGRVLTGFTWKAVYGIRNGTYGYYYQTDQYVGPINGVVKTFYLRNKYVLSFNTMGGPTAVASVEVPYDKVMSNYLPAGHLSAYVKDSTTKQVSGLTYLFKGWFADADGLGQEYTFSEKMPANAVSVYAKWTPLPVDVLYFKTMSGTGMTTLKIPYNMSINQAIANNLFGPLEHFPPAGMVNPQFEGWFRKDSQGKYIPFDLDEPILAPVTLYPVYLGLPYQITYLPGAGSGSVPTDSNEYAYGVYATLKGKGGLVPPAGQVFLGWKLPNDTTVYAPNDNILIDDNKTLTAVYGPIPTLTKVTYQPGTGQGSNYTVNQLPNNATHTVLPIGNGSGQIPFSNPGFDFAGWQASGTLYQPGEVVMLDDLNQDSQNVFVAQWKPILTNVTVTKVWDDANNQDGKRPASLPIVLKGSDNVEHAITLTSAHAVAGNANKWQYTFTGIHKYKNGALIVYNAAPATLTETIDAALGYTLTTDLANLTLTNRRTPETVEVKVTKVWEDASNQDGKRPANLPIVLKGSDGVARSATLSGTGNTWTYTYTNLPKYKNGALIVYNAAPATLTETIDAALGYTLTTDLSTLTLTNSRTPETVDIKVTKVWEDASNQDGKRPASLHVVLKGSDNVEHTATLNGAGNTWTHTFTALPKYKDGVVIDYHTSLTETIDAALGYTLTTDLSTLTLTNSRTPETVDIKVTKVWEDASNQDGKRPASLHVMLKGSDNVEHTATLNGAGNTWTHTFTGLPKYKDGVVIDYHTSLTETLDAALGYTLTTDLPTLTLTNSRTPETVEVKVTKVWEDASNQDGKRPANLPIVLKGSDNVAHPASMNGTGNTWTHTFTGLPKYKNGVLIDYHTSLTEADLSSLGYQSSTDLPTLTLTNSRTPETVEVKVTKVWEDASNQDGKRPASLPVVLKGSDNVEHAATLNGTGNTWTHTFTGLPKYKDGVVIDYHTSLTETIDSALGYTLATDLATLTLTNSRTPETVDIKVTKVWEDANNQDGKRPANLPVVLKGSDDVEHAATLNGTGNTWTHTFTGLPKYKDGVVIDYHTSLTETLDAALGYTLATDLATLTLTNSRTPETVEVKVTKVWEDANNQDGKRPSDLPVVLKGSDNVEHTATLNGSGNTWTHTFTGLPKYKDGVVIDYHTSLTETIDAALGYSLTTDLSTLTLTNSRTPETVEVKVTKVWEDASNQDGKRPANLPVVLKGSDNVEHAVTLSGTGNTWTHTFTDLPKYKDGVVIDYHTSLTETIDATLGYTLTTDLPTLTLTNSRTPETVEVKVTKVWEDASNQDGKRPASLSVVLKGSDNVEHAATLNGTGNTWTHTFTGLPKYKDGVVIDYHTSLTETLDAALGYTLATDLATLTLTNSRATETVDIKVTKVWEDASNQDGKRPASLSVVLKGSDNVEHAATLNGTGNTWTHTFTGLPKYKDGVVIDYHTSLTETIDSALGYTLATDLPTLTLTNSRTPETVEVKVTKVWEDASNQDGKRPANLPVVLKGSDNVEHAAALSGTGNTWTHTFTGLPKYKDGVVIDYHTSLTETMDAALGYTLTTDLPTLTLTNSRTTETVDIKVTKVWEDASNQDGKRPANLPIILKGSDNVEHSITLTSAHAVAGDANKWQHTFTGLPKYKDGVVIDYHTSLTETIDAALGYTLATDLATLTLTNSRTPETVEVKVTKVWEDASNQDGKRPASLPVVLKGSDNVEHAATLSGTGNTWTHTFTGLPKYKDGVVIDYHTSLTETIDAALGYTLATDLATLTLTNSRTPETVEVNVTKVWEDASNQDGKRPANLPVVLKGSDNVEHAITLTSAHAVAGDANKWQYTFTGLPKYKDGVVIDYHASLTETIDAALGYTLTTDLATLTLTNSRTTETVDIKVTKVWEDASNQDGKRPANLPIILKGSDNVEHSATLNGTGNTWTHTFTGLPKYKDGVVIDYHTSLTETIDSALGYTLATDLPTLTLTNSRTPETVEVKGQKTWEDQSNSEATRPDSLEVTLTKTVNGTATVLSITPTWTKAGDTWSYTYGELPKYEGGQVIAYSVAETVPAGYEKTSTDLNENRDFTNRMRTTSVAGKKTWSDLVPGEVRPDAVTIQLFRSPAGAEGATAYRSTQTVLNAYAFDNLPTHNQDGVAYVYSTQEVTPVGYVGEQNGHDFHNTYKAFGQLALSGNKTFTGRPKAEEDRFDIDLFLGEFTRDTLPATPSDSVSVHGSDSFAFAALHFTHLDVGEKVYTIAERQGTVGGVTYDLAVHHVRVVISLNADQTLDIAPSDNYNSLAFTNQYKAKGEYDIDLELHPTKELTGRKLKDQEFTFTLSQGETLLQTVKNDAEGRIPFEKLAFTQDDIGKTHVYTIKEVEPETPEGGMTYDSMTLTFSLHIEDGKNGQLIITVEKPEDTVFNNAYVAKGEYDITLQLQPKKELAGRKLADQEFTFTLSQGDTMLQTVKNTAEGQIPFQKLAFTQADIGKTYAYHIREVKGAQEHMSYDPMALTFQLTITDGGNGQLKIAAQKPQDVVFNNTYTPPEAPPAPQPPTPIFDLGIIQNNVADCYE